MKKLLLTLSFMIVLSAFGLTAQAASGTAVPAGTPTPLALGGEIQFNTVATLPADTDLTFTPEND